MKVAKLICIPLLAMFAAGCIEYHQELTIRRDGSGEVRVHLVVTKTFLDMRDRARREGVPLSPRADLPMSEEEVRKKFEGDTEITVKDIKIGAADGKHHVFYTLESKSLSRLFQACELHHMNLERDSQGNYALWTKRKVAQKRPLSPEEQVEEDEMRRQAKRMLQGLKVSLKINVPAEIIETSAHARITNAAHWSFDIEKDAAFLDEEPEIRVKFRGTGLQLREVRALAPDEVAE
jgi:hypothetical protein